MSTPPASGRPASRDDGVGAPGSSGTAGPGWPGAAAPGGAGGTADPGVDPDLVPGILLDDPGGGDDPYMAVLRACPSAPAETASRPGTRSSATRHPARGALRARRDTPHYPRQPSLGEAWRWGWSALVSSPVVMAGLVTWVLAALAVLTWIVVYLPVTRSQVAVYACAGELVLMVSLGVIGLTNAARVLAAGRVLRYRDFFLVPGQARAVLAVIVCTVVMEVAHRVPYIFITSFVVAYFLCFTVPIVLCEEVGPIEAIARSCALAMENVGAVLPVLIVGYLMILVGIVTLLGWIVLVPVEILMVMFTYLCLTGQDVARIV
ncbi:hypothetical protein [uncultured Actinomyces sp.]|uniref:hypothetical protein n=1 Tax=uncultured Actinomyces sp. TaxID=249061 RepID=UPI00261A2BB7|nr:hypothetical protein [uncultured Actinomyces sp.]